MTKAELVVYPLHRAVRGLLSLRTIGQEDRLSLRAIDDAAANLVEAYNVSAELGFCVAQMVTQADPLYERAQAIAAKYCRR